MSSGRTLFVLSTGDWATSIEARQAHRRLEAMSGRGVFERVLYVFFRTEENRSFKPEEWLEVHEVAGSSAGLPGPVGKLAGHMTGAARIVRLAIAASPDAILATDPFVSGALGLLLKARLRVPLAVALFSDYRLSWRAAHVPPPGPFPTSLSFLVHDRVLSSADLVLCDRQYYARCALDAGVRSERIHVHPMWAEDPFYPVDVDPAVLARLGLDDPRPLVYVGRLSPEKYTSDLFAAWMHVRKTYPRRALVVAGGSGPLRSWLERVAREASVVEDLRILQVSAAEVASLMALAGVVLAPHAGYTLLEGALSGARFVAYDFESHGEFVVDGETGRLVPYRNWQKMAEAALDLLADPQDAAQMGEELRSRALARHRQDLVVESVDRAFRAIVEHES